MDAATFLDSFGYLAEAPNGVEKLREMVLDLAVRGRLVDQNPKDEPAEALLERVAQEKKRLVKEKLLRVSKTGGAVAAKDQPFEIPASWKWTRLHDAGIINPRNDADDSLEVSFTPMALISDQYGEPPQHELRRWSEVKSGFTHFAENDVVMAKITPCFQNRKSTVMRGLSNGIGAGTTELHVFRPIEHTLLPDYVLVYLKSGRFIEVGITQMTGSAGQKRVPKDYIAMCPFPLPPLAEQQRIVAKVDELMASCDELEARQQERRTVHVSLNEAALDCLTTAESEPDFTTAWTRVRANFDLLYSIPENVTALRQTILQLAVMGKLVEQDPDDEPAARILEQSKAVKKQLIDTQQMRKPSGRSESVKDEYDFEIPTTWIKAELEDLFRFIDYRGKTPKKSASGVRLITAKNVRMGWIDNDPVEYVTDSLYQKWMVRGFPRLGDLLLVTEGATMGFVAQVNLEFTFALAQRTIDLQAYDSTVENYMLFCLMSPFFQRKMEANATGSAAQGVKAAKLRNFTVPLPPSGEQQRIVTRVNELMSLCDELEARLTQQQTDADRLAEAMIAGVLER